MEVNNTFDTTKIENKIKAGLGLVAESSARQLESQAKTNRPWTDRTSNARNSIRGTSDWVGDSLEIVLSGNVEYFEHLELAREKQYAILMPTVEANSSEVFNALKKVLE